MKYMNQKRFFLVAVVCSMGSAPALAAEEDSADLSSYSVGGDRRLPIETQKVEIERPTFENSFKFEPAKPSISGIQIAKPRLQVLPPAAAEASSGEPAAAAGAPPAVNNTAPAAGDRPVQPLSMAPPEYPREALRRREEGYVVLEFTIGTDGRTRDIEVVDSEPRHTFEQEARRAVSRWTFEPAIEDGRPVAQRIRHTVEFTLGQ